METNKNDPERDKDVMSTAENKFKELLDQIVEFRFSEPEKALKFATQLLELSKKDQDYYHIALAKYYIGDTYLTLGEFDKASENTLEAIQIEEKYGFLERLGKSYNNLGAIFYSQADYVLAMKYLIKALEIALETKEYQTQAFIYNNMAAVFLLYYQYKRAHGLFEKAWAAREHCDKGNKTNHYGLTRMHMNLGICMNSEGKYEEAKVILDEILAEVTPDELENIQLYLWEFAAGLSENLGDDEKAIDYALKMAEGVKGNLYPEDIVVTLESIRILIAHGYYKEAEELLNTDQEVCVKAGTPLNETMLIDEWLKLYETRGDEEAKNRCYKRYYELIQLSKPVDRANQVTALENRNLLTSVGNENSDLLKANNQIEEISNRDSLTGLLNRSGMKHVVDTILSKNMAEKSNMNLAIIDIDRFKEYNDTYGHLIGDECLVSVSEIIHKAENDHIFGARFGGDEFFLIGDGLLEPVWEEHVKNLMEAIRSSFLTIDKGRKISVTTSIGIVSGIPEKNTEFHDYIHKADEALYHVKKNGRNGYYVYQKQV